MNNIIKISRRFSAFFVIFLIFSLPGYGEIIFSDLDLADDNRLLFRAGISNQDAFFLTNLPGQGITSAQIRGEERSFRLLSAFPEKMELLEDGKTLQIRNSFGAMRVPLSGGLPMLIPGIPSFSGGNLAASGRAEEMISSSDGRWLLYLHPVSPSLGDLIMVDLITGIKTLIASRLERPETVFPASWSPDSRFFLYERGGKLFFYVAGSSLVPADEKLRLLGDGKINSVSWGRGGDFYYLRDSTLYRVRGHELFARTFYADFLEIGSVAGKIPFEFDPCFDNFWIAPDASSLLVSKGRRSLICFPLDSSGNSNTGSVTGGITETILPYLMLPRLCSGINVLWPAANGSGGTAGALMPTILVSIRENGGSKVNVWRLSQKAVFEPLTPQAVTPQAVTPQAAKSGSFPQGALSPDGRLALLWGSGGILLYDFTNWKLVETISNRPGTFCLWAGNDECITGNDEKIERIRLGKSASQAAYIARRELLCLSRASQAGFEEKSTRILARNGDTWFVTDGRNPWNVIAGPRQRTPSQVSAQYRVYLEDQLYGAYENLPMIRNVASVGTVSLFTIPPGNAAPPVPRAGKAALCFDLYDDDRGLPETLDALNRFGIKATFFLNGEFLRRHPEAARDIAAAGHEAASMFFALIDLSDSRYRTDSDFITRGLARNEDEFYKVTGKELSLLWHPPWYTVSPNIITAAAKAGYASSRRDFDPMDWVSQDDEKKLGLPQRSPAEMVDYILKNVSPGSVIPVRLGLVSGGRNDYLFNRINVLLDALIREGYKLTTVSELLNSN